MKTTPFNILRYDHDGVPLNVTGTRDEDECTITRVTAADSQIDLFDLFPVNTLCLMADRIDAQLSDDATQHNKAARAEIHQWNREFRVSA